MKMHQKLSRALKPSGRQPAVSLMEPLENRQLLSAVIDLRLADGSKTIHVTKPGQVINVDVWAVVTGTNSTGSDEGFQDLFGSFVSTDLGAGSVKGNLMAANVAPFDGGGAAPGKQADLNGDGNLDVGSTAAGSTDYFLARANDMQTSGGVISGASASFEVASLAYTVTSLGSGGETDVNFVPRNARINAVWREDGHNLASILGGTLLVGAPLRLTGTGVQPKPIGATITGTVIKDLNGNKVKDAGDGGLAGVTVFIDTNKNGKRDPGEIFTITNSHGNYSFSGLAAGTYRIVEVIPSPLKAAAPKSGYLDVTVKSNVVVSGKNFFDIS